jgi:hypothetical protein
MKRVVLVLSLACLTLGAPGCCWWQGSGWSPCCWPGCGGGGCGGGDCGGGDCGGGCGDSCGGWGGWNGFGCGRPGGCGEIYWGDWCTGNPHCSTCDDCGNWVGPPSPGGNGLGPDTYSRAHPYGFQVVRNGAQSMPNQPSRSQMARRSPPSEYSPKMTHGTRSYVARPRSSGPQGQQYAQRGPAQEYEGAVQYLGTTDRLVKPATLPGRSTSSTANVARRSGQPTLADPQTEDFNSSRVQRTSQRTYVR